MYPDVHVIIHMSFSTGGEEYPTLLHWAARFGLERVCWQLLECPGGGAALALRNVRRRAPADLARDHQHRRLADMLADHLVPITTCIISKY